MQYNYTKIFRTDKRFIKLDHREVYDFCVLDSFNLTLLSSDSDPQFFFRADTGVWFHKPN